MYKQNSNFRGEMPSMLATNVRGLVYKIGVVADVQYANIPDAYDYSGTNLRKHSQTSKNLRQCVDLWKQENVDLIIDLGDLVEGFKNDKAEKFKEMEKMLSILYSSDFDVLHAPGNHEFYNFTRAELDKLYMATQC